MLEQAEKRLLEYKTELEGQLKHSDQASETLKVDIDNMKQQISRKRLEVMHWEDGFLDQFGEI